MEIDVIDGSKIFIADKMFRTVHVMNDNGFKRGSIVVCTIREKGEYTDQFTVGCAFCSPNDVFNKKHGQIIAENRAISPRSARKFLHVKSYPPLGIKDQIKRIIALEANRLKIRWMSNVSLDELV